MFKTQVRSIGVAVKNGKRILVTNIRVSHLATQVPQVDGKVITCQEQ